MAAKVKHTVRTSENGRVEIEMGMTLAIKLKCMDCLGYEARAESCTSTLCPLFPFRGNTLLSRHGYKPREITEEQRAASSERLKNARETRIGSTQIDWVDESMGEEE